MPFAVALAFFDSKRSRGEVGFDEMPLCVLDCDEKLLPPAAGVYECHAFAPSPALPLADSASTPAELVDPDDLPVRTPCFMASPTCILDT
jgi:hypothetical protein